MHAMSYVCSCYFTNNVFLHSYRLHVTYHTERQFLEDYRELLESRGCRGKEKFAQVLSEVRAEVERRRNEGKEQLERCRVIQGSYKKLHPEVYTLQERYFEPGFLQAVSYAKSPHASPETLTGFLREEEAANVYSLPVFTREFCAKLMEELDNFERANLPKGRPNTMNKGGLLLSELGFDVDFVDPLRTDYLLPLARLLYPDWVGKELDSHRAFVVKYSMGDDVELSYHFDNAEVTLNVCLGSEFTDGDLYFGSMRTERGPGKHERWTTYQHGVGRGLLHRAQHMHGAQPITSGSRYNLIIWMRSSSLRNLLCPMCNETPTLVPNPGFGDGFTTLVPNPGFGDGFTEVCR